MNVPETLLLCGSMSDPKEEFWRESGRSRDYPGRELTRRASFP